MAEVILATQDGTRATGAATASSFYDSNHNPTAAVDGNAWTFWNQATTDTSRQWWQLDLGGGNAIDIVTLTLQAKSEGYDGMPTTFGVVSSDDGTTWSAPVPFTATWTSAGQRQTFPLTPYVAPEAGKHRYWRINFTAANSPIFHEIEFRDTVGGLPLPVTNPFCSIAEWGGSLSSLFDGDPATSFRLGDGTVHSTHQIGNDFGWNSYHAIAEVAVTGQSSDSFSGVDIQYSDDNATWTTAASFTGLAPSSAQQVFAVGTAAPPATASPGFAMILA